jgi:hypothetical protein
MAQIRDRARDVARRVRVRWHAVIAAFSVAAPVLLQQLQVIDFKSVLQHYMSPEIAGVLVGLLPFYIAMLKPMIHFEDHHDQ